MNIQLKTQGVAALRLLTGKVSLVTGSTSGIGLGIARALAEAGSAVVLNGLGVASEIAKTREQIAADFGVIIDKTVGTDVGAFANASALRDNRSGMYARSVARRLVEELDGVRKGEVRIGAAQGGDWRETGFAVQGDTLVNQDGGSARGLQEREVATVSQEGNLAGLGVLDAGDAVDVNFWGAFESAG